MRRGILIFQHPHQEWRVWIGQQSYWIEQGYTFELRIKNQYFNALLEKDSDWFITINQDVSFVLHTDEIYKIRINIHDYIPVNTPF
ncbi:DUF5348 domain-containing protein [Bacillus sp. IITD106]|nr:DUF5348 domain-containing protein [Bacillus sp. IITD106]